MSAVINGGTIINARSLEAKLVKAFETWARFDVNDYFRDQFLEDRWPYNGETERKNGELATSPRNIYDLGDLYKSGRDSFSISQGGVDISASWEWNAKNSSGRAYAWYVHEGLGTNASPRQWTDDLQVPARFDSSVLSKELKDRIRNVLGK